MFKHLIRAAALLSMSCAAPLAAQGPVTPSDLLRHISVLASDEFAGRAPGTEGERRTTGYLVAQFQARGLQPAGENGTWFQTLHLASRRPEAATLRWTGTQPGQLGADDIVVTGREGHEVLTDAPLIFAAHGARLPERGIDQLAGADVRGAVVLILFEGPQIEGFPPIAQRVRAVAAAGAAAVIVVVTTSDTLTWEQIRGVVRRGALRPDDPGVPRFSAVMPMASAR